MHTCLFVRCGFPLQLYMVCSVYYSWIAYTLSFSFFHFSIEYSVYTAIVWLYRKSWAESQLGVSMVGTPINHVRRLINLLHLLCIIYCFHSAARLVNGYSTSVYLLGKQNGIHSCFVLIILPLNVRSVYTYTTRGCAHYPNSVNVTLLLKQYKYPHCVVMLLI